MCADQDGSSSWSANLLTGRSVVRIQPPLLDFPYLDLGTLAVNCELNRRWSPRFIMTYCARDLPVQTVGGSRASTLALPSDVPVDTRTRRQVPLRVGIRHPTDGNARDAQNNDLLSHLGITHIINVSVTVAPPFTNNQLYRYLILPVVDTDEQNLRPSIDRAVDFIYEAEKSNGIVLVHCVAGVSRSVAIVMAYLMHKYRNFTVLRALDFIQSRRPIAGPNLHFMGQLEHYYAELHSEPCQNPASSPHRHSRRSSYVDFGEELNSADFTVS
ncbi:hypothetical protein T265_09889 [Opisthorchis viverrini]|uniref:protein-tyrosine-phosphatase n=1 Tax=Opisthorchis viverrini TaxID=6198 RepID=A0A075A3A2_OPIVI|nr:hypothetical protein T265_09889 [Opisthorchis viverrini]KER21884.1 hypothetical protein T265_09889 [Opisthorchis viverrini]